MEQDPKFALRCSSTWRSWRSRPLINDPTTAVQALDQIEDLLRRIGQRTPDMGRLVGARGHTRVTYPAPTWGDMLALGLDEICMYGAGSLQVVRRLRMLLLNLDAAVCRGAPRCGAGTPRQARRCDRAGDPARRPSGRVRARSSRSRPLPGVLTRLSRRSDCLLLPTFRGGLIWGARNRTVTSAGYRRAVQPARRSRRVNRFTGFVLVLSCGVVALVSASSTPAALRMPVGFQDDPTFRWNAGAARPSIGRRSRARVGHSHVRRLARDRASPSRGALEPVRPGLQVGRSRRTRPQRADSAESADHHDLGHTEVGERRQGPNVPPKKLADLTNFARALAERYSGRHAGYPYVGRYSIWNEPNLEIFLAPQFDPKGNDHQPAHLRRGSTRPATRESRRGTGPRWSRSARHRTRVATTLSRGRERLGGARARSRACSRGRRASGSTPTRRTPTRRGRTSPPTQKVRWPNVTLSQLPTLRDLARPVVRAQEHPDLDHRVRLPDETGRADGRHRTRSRPRYLSQAMRQLKDDPRVQMFIWFIFRDSPQSDWQSGLLTPSGTTKPSYRTFSVLRALDRGQTLADQSRDGSRRFSSRFRSSPSAPASGSSIGVTYRVFRGTTLVAVGQPVARLRTNGTVRFVARFKPAAGTTIQDRDGRRRHQRQPRDATYILATRGTAKGPRTG